MSMYSFSNEDLNKINEIQKSLPFPVSACVDHVTLRDCKLEELGTTGINAIILYWERKVGGTEQGLRQSIIEINKDNIMDRASNNGKNGKEELDKEVIRFKSKLTHICGGFGISKEDVADAANTVKNFTELANTICNMIKENNTGQEFYMKTLVNKKGYVETAAFPNFIQNMDSGVCNMKYSKYELEMIERNRQPTGSVTTEASTGSDDVPVAANGPTWVDNI